MRGRSFSGRLILGAAALLVGFALIACDQESVIATSRPHSRGAPLFRNTDSFGIYAGYRGTHEIKGSVRFAKEVGNAVCLDSP